jgi:hypothetical protein
VHTGYNGILFAFKLFINTTSAHTDYKLLYEQSEQVVLSLKKTIEEQQHLIEQHQSLVLQHQSLQLQINELKKIIFGSKSEKFVAAGNSDGSTQPDLFPTNKLGGWEVMKTTVIKQHEKKQVALNVNHPGRNPLPQNLRREVIELQPTENVSDLKPVAQKLPRYWNTSLANCM